MYPSQPCQQDDSGWEYTSTPGYDAGRLNSALPKPPAYLPPPVPPSDALAELRRPQRLWFRIPSEKPVLTLGILGVLVIVFIITTLIGGSIDATENEHVLINAGAKVNLR